jgi:folate-binding protein YgfZ
MRSAAENYREFQARGGVVDLSDRLKLILTGADRARYLNGQVTSNVQKLATDQAQRACVTTAKGKLCAEVVITASLDAIFIDADASLRETLPARLERYMIADDAALRECEDGTRLLHFLGPKPDWLGEVAPDRGLPVMRKAARFGREGWDWWADAETVDAKWNVIRERVAVLDETVSEILRIEAGVPRWGRELNEDTLPPEAGLDRTHIDYHKGCYIGQEVISRLKSVGHVNRSLSGFISVAGVPLSAGAALFVAGDETRAVGVLTSAGYSFALEKPVALGYLKRGSPPGELLARPAEGPGAEAVVTVSALPLLS